MSSEFRVLVHPSFFPQSSEYHEIWRAWIASGCHILTEYENDSVRTVDELEDNSYVDELMDGCIIVLGGQILFICVAMHYKTLLSHPRIKHGNISVEVDLKATRGADLQSLVQEAQAKHIPLRLRR